MNKQFFIAFLILLLTSCKQTSDEQVLAKVGDEYLYPSLLLGDDYTQEDVNNISEEQITNWIKRQLWYIEAEDNVKNTTLIEQNLQDYRKSLYINAYQDKMLSENEALVSKDDVIQYYAEHKADFALNESLYKIQYVLFETNPQEEQNDALLKSLNNDNPNKYIQDYCSENASNCQLKAVWLNDEKLQALGITDFYKKTAAKFDIVCLDNGKELVYRITEKKRMGEPFPLELIENEVVGLIMFKKSKSIFEQKEEQLFKNAQKNQKFEIYK